MSLADGRNYDVGFASTARRDLRVPSGEMGLREARDIGCRVSPEISTK